MDYTEVISHLKIISQTPETEFYIVGGAVRDNLLGQDGITDIDISVCSDFESLLGLVKEHFKIKEKTQISLFKTATVRIENISIDFVTARKEFYDKPGMLPRIEKSDIHDDISRRDFTVNSIAYDIAKDRYIDPLFGADDLKKKIIRKNREGIFAEDPTRIFRFFKYLKRFNFHSDESTEKELNDSLKIENLFNNVSKSRISREWMLILEEKEADSVIDDLKKHSVFRNIFKEDIKCRKRGFDSNDEFVKTLDIFFDNDFESLVMIMDTLFNGLKKSEIKELEMLKNLRPLSNRAKEKYSEFLKNRQPTDPS